jgi:hypothetical protein
MGRGAGGGGAGVPAVEMVAPVSRPWRWCQPDEKACGRARAFVGATHQRYGRAEIAGFWTTTPVFTGARDVTAALEGVGSGVHDGSCGSAVVGWGWRRAKDGAWGLERASRGTQARDWGPRRRSECTRLGDYTKLVRASGAAGLRCGPRGRMHAECGQSHGR